MLYKSYFYDMNFNVFGIEFEKYLNKLMDFLIFFFFCYAGQRKYRALGNNWCW